MKWFLNCLVVCLALGCLSNVAAGFPTQYQIRDLGTPGFARGVNSSGAVVGQLAGRGVIWDAGGWARELDIVSEASAISDSGYVVGTTSACRAVLLRPDGFFRYLDYVPGYSCMTFAKDVNDAGQVAGEARDDTSKTKGFKWSPDSGMLPLEPAPGYAESRAEGIDSLGRCVGYSLDGSRFCGTIWSANGSAAKLGLLDGYGRSQTFGINDAGQVVGVVVDESEHGRAALWETDGSINVLGLLLPDIVISVGYAINNLGQVVGASCKTGFYHATLWNPDGTIVDLGTLGGNYSAPSDINDAGKIVGEGYDERNSYNHALTWEPIPEPSSLIALLCGLGGLGYAVRRQRDASK